MMKVFVASSIYIVGVACFLILNSRVIVKHKDRPFMPDFTVGLVSILWPITWWITVACWYSIRRSVKKAQRSIRPKHSYRDGAV